MRIKNLYIFLFFPYSFSLTLFYTILYAIYTMIPHNPCIYPVQLTTGSMDQMIFFLFGFSVLCWQFANSILSQKKKRKNKKEKKNIQRMTMLWKLWNGSKVHACHVVAAFPAMLPFTFHRFHRRRKKMPCHCNYTILSGFFCCCCLLKRWSSLKVY